MGEEAFSTLEVNRYLPRVGLAAEVGIFTFAKLYFIADNVKNLFPYAKKQNVAWAVIQITEIKRRVGGQAERRKHFRGFLGEGDV